MKTTNFFGHEISRLIVGDNPFTGHSYIEYKITGNEMKEYYNSRRLYEELFRIEAAGYTCMLPLAHPFNIEILSEYRRDGGKMDFIFQPYMPMDQNVSMRQMEAVEPIGIYHQGTTTDLLYETDQVEKIKDTVSLYRAMGVPVGIGTHYPEVIEKAEAEEWGADFYLACLHNARRDRKGEASGFLTGKNKAEFVFYPEDRPIMLDTIARTKKPCIAFKIFAGGQIFTSDDESQRRQTVKNVYKEVFSKLKPTDVAAIGVFNKYHDQVKEDAELFTEAMEEMR